LDLLTEDASESLLELRRLNQDGTRKLDPRIMQKELGEKMLGEAEWKQDRPFGSRRTAGPEPRA
jgi:hypothetical protein